MLVPKQRIKRMRNIQYLKLSFDLRLLVPMLWWRNSKRKEEAMKNKIIAATATVLFMSAAIAFPWLFEEYLLFRIIAVTILFVVLTTLVYKFVKLILDDHDETKRKKTDK